MSNNRDNGNAAAMREALNQLRDWALLDINENAIRPDEPNYKKLCDGIVEITNAALSAPPRNCDLYSNTAKALGAYPDGPPIGDEWDDADWMMFLDWLFATEKGGTK